MWYAERDSNLDYKWNRDKGMVFCDYVISGMLTYNYKQKQIIHGLVYSAGPMFYIGLSERTIGRMRDPENESHKLNAVVAVCVALHLNAYQGSMMLMLAGYTLKNTKTDCMYRFFIDFAFKETVLECNNALIRCGLKPLTKLHD